MTVRALSTLRAQTAEPLRQAIAAELRARIEVGEWDVGDRLPSEPALARQHAVSRASVRAAITVLEQQGRVIRRHGSGTYVAPQGPIEVNLGSAEPLGAHTRKDHLLDAVDALPRTGPAPAGIADALSLAPGAPVCVRERVEVVGRRAVLAVTEWWRVDRREFEPGGHRTSAGLVRRGPVCVAPGNADEELACRLKVPSGAQLLVLTQVGCGPHGGAVVVCRVHYLADAFAFTRGHGRLDVPPTTR